MAPKKQLSIKVHFPRKGRTKRGNYVMVCGKRFSSGDRKRLRKHVTTVLERINCPGCLDGIAAIVLNARRFQIVEEAEEGG